MGIAENADIEGWMGKETPEEVLEPNLPIIDPHHHLWDLRRSNGMGFRQAVYLCEEISRDISDSGHNIVQTVFAQCGAFYRADGPKEMRCIGETEFVNGMQCDESVGSLWPHQTVHRYLLNGGPQAGRRCGGGADVASRSKFELSGYSQRFSIGP